MAVKIGTFYRCNNGVSHVQDTPTLWLTVTNIYWYHLISSQKLTLSMQKGLGRGFEGDPSWPSKSLGFTGWIQDGNPQKNDGPVAIDPIFGRCRTSTRSTRATVAKISSILWLQATFPGLQHHPKRLWCEKSS
jgi:hypothetical protein